MMNYNIEEQSEWVESAEQADSIRFWIEPDTLKMYLVFVWREEIPYEDGRPYVVSFKEKEIGEIHIEQEIAQKREFDPTTVVAPHEKIFMWNSEASYEEALECYNKMKDLEMI